MLACLVSIVKYILLYNKDYLFSGFVAAYYNGKHSGFPSVDRFRTVFGLSWPPHKRNGL